MSGQPASRRAAEDYLEALLLLERGTGDVRGAQLARHLGVSKASVSIAMKRLKQEGYVSVGKGRDLLLTDAGRAIACRVYERHCFSHSCFSALASNRNRPNKMPAGWSTPSARRAS